jgi:hypothetical protein
MKPKKSQTHGWRYLPLRSILEECTQASNIGTNKLYPITVGTMNLALTLPKFKDSRSVISLLVTLNSSNLC